MTILDQMNMSELVELAQETNPEAHRGLSREVLKDIITKAPEEGPALPEKKINKHRLRIMNFVLEHWEQVKPMLKCPAGTGDPRACFNCTDIQVMECVATNHHNIYPKKRDQHE
jgi:hypothetical protein